MTTTIYAIALSLVKYLGVQSSLELIDAMGGITPLLCDPQEVSRRVPRLQRRILAQLLDPTLLHRAEDIYRQCQELAIRPCSILDPDYPPLLKESTSPPFVLYIRGAYTQWSTRTHLSLVGTRAISSYGQELVCHVIEALAIRRPNSTVVSGLAYGVDIQAHRLALSHGLPTISVLAHGLDMIYPSVHTRTAMEMLEQGGALVSEYPPGVKPCKQAFVARNRIIAGLSEGTLIIEAGERSGSLSTARYAFDANREVFAFPGRVTDLQSAGCHRLIQEAKAHLCLGLDTVAQELGWEQPDQDSALALNKRAEDVVCTSSALPDHPILHLLQAQGELLVDELARALQLDLPTISSQLFDLEMDGYVEALSGGRYRLHKLG